MEPSTTVESLAGFALLVTLGSFVLGIFVVVSFFIMAFNIGSILKYTKAISMHHEQIQSSLDALLKVLRDQPKDKIQ